MSLGAVICVILIRCFAMHLIFVYIAVESFSLSDTIHPYFFFFFNQFNTDQTMLIPITSQLQDPTHHPTV